MGDHVNFEHQTESHDVADFTDEELRVLALLAIYNGFRIVKKALFTLENEKKLRSILESEDSNDGNDGNDFADA